jgi:hypothetical protein
MVSANIQQQQQQQQQQNRYTMNDINKHVKSTLSDYVVSTINDVSRFSCNPVTRKLIINREIDETFVNLYKSEIVLFARGLQQSSDWVSFTTHVESMYTEEIQEILIDLRPQIIDVLIYYFEWDEDDVDGFITSNKRLWYYYCLSRFEVRIERMSLNSLHRMINSYEVPINNIGMFLVSGDSDSDSDSDYDPDDEFITSDELVADSTDAAAERSRETLLRFLGPGGQEFLDSIESESESDRDD